MPTREAVEIRDALTSGLLSTLEPTEPTSGLTGGPTYSPDGRSIACASGAMIIIWDIQTGGVVKEIRRDEAGDASLVWSLGGRVIGTMSWRPWTMCVYDVVSGTAPSQIKLKSRDRPHLWAYGDSFRVAITRREDRAFAMEIFEVWPAIAKIDTFRIDSLGGFESLGRFDSIRSFSPTTYRASVQLFDWRTLVLDIRTSQRLLVIEWRTQSDCFSSDGSFFAASPKTSNSIHIWKYTAGRYTPWRKFPIQDGLNDHLQFSPTSSSILVRSGGVLRVRRLDIPPTSLSAHNPQCIAFSCSGAYIATTNNKNSIVIITNLLSLAPSQLIDTGLEIHRLVLTGNVLLTVGIKSTVAWLLTEEGGVYGVPGDRRAGPGDSIWTVPMGWGLTGVCLDFLVEGQIGAIRDQFSPGIAHVYHTQTGEIISSSPSPFYHVGNWRDPASMTQDWRHLRYHNLDERNCHVEDNWLVTQSAIQGGWVKDPAGKHRFWVPVDWRAFQSAEWFYDITTLRLKLTRHQSVIRF